MNQQEKKARALGRRILQSETGKFFEEIPGDWSAGPRWGNSAEIAGKCCHLVLKYQCFLVRLSFLTIRVIKDDAEVLEMFREVMKGQGMTRDGWTGHLSTAR